MAKFTDEQRASAVAMLQALGGVESPTALADVAKHIKVSERQLRRWAKGESNPPPDNLVTEKKQEIGQVLEAHLLRAIASLDGKLEDASYKDTGTVIGIIMDKLANLNGEPSQITRQIIDFERKGLSSVPQHLSPGANADSGGAPPV